MSACECSEYRVGGARHGGAASWEAEKISGQGRLVAQRAGLCRHRGQGPERPMTAGSHPCDCSAASGQVGDPGRGPGSRRCENGALLSPVLAQLPRDLLRGVSLDLHEETKWPAPLRSAAFQVPRLLCVPSLLCLRGTEHPWAMAGPRGHLHGGHCRPFPTKLQMLPGQLSNSQTRNAKRPPVES